MPRIELKQSDNLPVEAHVLSATDVVNHYWIGTIYRADGETTTFALAVNQTAIEPQIYRTDAGLLFIGVEQGIFCLDPSTGKLVSEGTVAAYVQSIEPTTQGDIVVSAEIEMLMFDASGKIRWRVNLPSIIVDVVEGDGCLKVELDNGETLILSSDTGRAATVRST